MNGYNDIAKKSNQMIELLNDSPNTTPDTKSKSNSTVKDNSDQDDVCQIIAPPTNKFHSSDLIGNGLKSESGNEMIGQT